MIFLIYTQNLTTISSFGDYVSNKNEYRHQTERQADRQTDGNGTLLFSYSSGHETSRKYKSGHSSYGLDTFLAYVWEVKMYKILENK